MPLPSYSTGTVSIGAGATAVVGVGTLWNDANARAGDTLIVDGHQVLVEDVTDATHLAINAWPFTAVSAGASYKIVHSSRLRANGGDAMQDISKIVTALNTDGYIVTVLPTETVPNPSYGDENQYAYQWGTGKLWVKSGGVWVLLGIFKGFRALGSWSGATAYVVGDVITSAGSSYLCVLDHTNHVPPNVTYWQLLASKGDPGTNGSPGSAGPAAWATPPVAWLTATAYTATPPASVVVQAGETYVCAISHTSGTFATDLAASRWIKIAQKGTGDLLSTNNLSEVANAQTANRNLLPSSVASKSANYTVVAGDHDGLITLTGSFTLSLTAAATLGDKFKCRVRNVGTGIWTIDPNSTETIDGKATLTIGIGEELEINCNGTLFNSSASRGRLTELSRQTASSSATIDFDFASGFPIDFDEFEVHILNALPATNDTNLGLRVKTTGSLTVQTSGYQYASRIQGQGGGADLSSTSETITDRIMLARSGAGNGLYSGNQGWSGKLIFARPNVSQTLVFDFFAKYMRADGASLTQIGAGWYNTFVATTGLRLFMSSGNIASGEFVLYGIRK